MFKKIWGSLMVYGFFAALKNSLYRLRGDVDNGL